MGGRRLSACSFAIVALGGAAPVYLSLGRVAHGDVVAGVLSLMSVALLAAYAVIARRKWCAASQAATRDPLTGLANRRLLAAVAAHAEARAARGQGQVVVLAVDVDGLKTINDTYGHAAGDELLRRVAGRLTTVARASDVVARVGGDEFALLLDGDPAGSRRVADALISGAVELPLSAGEVTRVTLSVGAAELLPQENFEDALRRADDALLAAKRSRPQRAPAVETLAPAPRKTVEAGLSAAPSSQR